MLLNASSLMSGPTCIPGSKPGPTFSAFDCLFKISIVEDDEWRVASQLEGYSFDLICCLPHEALAHLGRAGKADLFDVRISKELVTDGRGLGGGDDIQHPRRKACIMSAAGDGQGCHGSG